MTVYIHPARQIRELEGEILALRKRLMETTLPFEEKGEICAVIFEKWHQLALLCYKIRRIKPPPEFLGKPN